MKKRIVSLLMCVVMTASFVVGCGSETSKKDSDKTNTETDETTAENTDIYDVENRTYEDVNIQILSRFDDADGQGVWYNKIVDDFMKEYPGITVEKISIPTESDYNDTLSVAMSDPSSMPNIFLDYGGSRVVDYIAAENIVDLTPYFEKDKDWYNSFGDVGWGLTDFSRFGYEGIFGVPYSAYFVSLFYNEDILNENNIDPATIKTWDDLMVACETLMNNGVQPFELGEKDNYRFGHLHTVLNYKTYGTEVAYKLGDRSMTYDSKEQLDIYQMIIDAYEAGYLGTNLLGTDDGQERELFNTGKTAFLFMGSWYCAEAATADLDLYREQKIHTIPFPYVNEEYAQHNMGGANEAFYVTKTENEDELAASVLFLKYMMSTEKIDELVSAHPILTAVNPTVQTDNYLMLEVQKLMDESVQNLGDIENYDTKQHMMNTVRNALQGIPSGYTAEDVGKNIIDTSSQYE